MTEEQKKLIAIARESLDDLCHEVNTATNWLPTRKYKAAREKIERALSALEAGEECDWTEDSDGIWHCSKCDCAWFFDCDGPVENKTHFCPECGREITEIKPYTQDYEADEDEQ
jgi:hypothetical protein